jgi:hypothetical protein
MNHFSLNFSGKEKATQSNATKKPAKKRASTTRTTKQPDSPTRLDISTPSAKPKAKPSNESGFLKSIEPLSRKRISALKDKISHAGTKLYHVALLPTSNTTKYIGKAALENILLYGATSLILPEGLILPGRLKDTVPVIVHFNQKLLPLLPFVPEALAKTAFKKPKATSEAENIQNPDTVPPDESSVQPSNLTKLGKAAKTVQELSKKVPGYAWVSAKLNTKGSLSRWLNDRPTALSISDKITRPLAAAVNTPNRYLEKHPTPVLPVKPDENATRYMKKKYKDELENVLNELQAHEKGLKKAKRISAFARGAALCMFLGFNYGWTDGIKTLWKLSPNLYPGQHQVVGTLSDTYNVPFTNFTSGIYRAPSAYIVAPVNPECIFELVDPITKQRFRCVTGGATAQELHRLWTFPVLGDDFAISLGNKPLAGGLRSGRVKPPVQDSVLMMVHEGKDILQFWRSWQGDQPGEFWVERNYDTWFKWLPVARITLKTPEELEGHPQEQALLRQLYEYEDGKPVRLNPDAMGAIAAVAGLELDSTFTTHKRDKDIQPPLKGH